MQARHMIVATLVVTLMALTGGAMLAGSPQQQPAGWGPELFSVPVEASDRVIPAPTSQKGPGALITVTTTNPVANPGDGDCSLIEAINNANADADTSGGEPLDRSAPTTTNIILCGLDGLRLAHPDRPRLAVPGIGVVARY